VSLSLFLFHIPTVYLNDISLMSAQYTVILDGSSSSWPSLSHSQLKVSLSIVHPCSPCSLDAVFSAGYKVVRSLAVVSSECMPFTDYSFNPLVVHRPLHALCRIIDIASVVAFHQRPVIHTVNSISLRRHRRLQFTALSLFHYTLLQLQLLCIVSDGQ
jgi:hypothetical protein